MTAPENTNLNVGKTERNTHYRQKCIKTKTKLLFRLNNQEIIIICGQEYNVDILTTYFAT